MEMADSVWLHEHHHSRLDYFFEGVPSGSIEVFAVEPQAPKRFTHVVVNVIVGIEVRPAIFRVFLGWVERDSSRVVGKSRKCYGNVIVVKSHPYSALWVGV
jgi:hypothetical protein